MEHCVLTCESCDQPARVRTKDGGLWCWSCDGAARSLGYDDEIGTPLLSVVAGDYRQGEA